MTLRQLRSVKSEIEGRADAQGVLRLWYDFRTGAALHKSTINMHNFMHWHVRPKCVEAGKSYVELVSQHTQRPRFFVTHWWGEPVALDGMVDAVEAILIGPATPA